MLVMPLQEKNKLHPGKLAWNHGTLKTTALCIGIEENGLQIFNVQVPCGFLAGRIGATRTAKVG